MAKSNNAFIKKQKAEVKRKKKLEKISKKIERQRNSTGGELENMMAYVDEFGNLTTTPPENKTEVKTTNKNN
ncbi:MAG TPA: cold-shock protein [Cyclobacteriaceae bacterium]|nr:cold-shock protein [Cyclobacteriaceae bacterium]HRJ83604.1 cold-shock protein [Cyclobacteriaceae bacterium]